MRLTIDTYYHATDRLTHLPDRLEVANCSAMADGGTETLHFELPNGVESMISLSPITSPIFRGRHGLLYLEALDRRVPEVTRYDIGARSDLRFQVVDLLKKAICRDDDCSRVLNRIVTFVESERYVELNEQHPRLPNE